MLVSLLSNRAGRNGLVALVLARSVFLKIKLKFYFFLQKQVMNKSASVMFGLVRLIKMHITKCKIIVCPHIVLTRYSVVQKTK